MNTYRKRGYVKWRDEDGKLHKIRENEYEAVEEIVSEEDVDGIMEESTDNGFV